MRNRFAIIPLILLVAVLWGCSNNNSQPEVSDSSAYIDQAVDILSEANSIEYTCTSEELYQNDGKEQVTQITVENIRIFEPYAYWFKNDTTRANDGKSYRSIIESYQVNQEERLDIYLRTSEQNTNTNSNAVPSPGNWKLQSLEDKAVVDMHLEWMKDAHEAQIYLLRASVNEFQFVEEAESDGEVVLKYSGTISPSSAIEAYKEYLRDQYVDMGFLKELDNPSSEELRDEIVNGDVLEIKVGIPALAYSEDPVPISLWINKDTFALQKVEIDKSVIIQPMLEKQLDQMSSHSGMPEVIRAFDTYVITGINNVKKPPIPEV